MAYCTIYDIMMSCKTRTAFIYEHRSPHTTYIRSPTTFTLRKTFARFGQTFAHGTRLTDPGVNVITLHVGPAHVHARACTTVIHGGAEACRVRVGASFSRKQNRFGKKKKQKRKRGVAVYRTHDILTILENVIIGTTTGTNNG